MPDKDEYTILFDQQLFSNIEQQRKGALQALKTQKKYLEDGILLLKNNNISQRIVAGTVNVNDEIRKQITLKNLTIAQFLKNLKTESIHLVCRELNYYLSRLRMFGKDGLPENPSQKDPKKPTRSLSQIGRAHV